MYIRCSSYEWSIAVLTCLARMDMRCLWVTQTCIYVIICILIWVMNESTKGETHPNNQSLTCFLHPQRLPFWKKCLLPNKNWLVFFLRYVWHILLTYMITIWFLLVKHTYKQTPEDYIYKRSCLYVYIYKYTAIVIDYILYSNI